MNSHAVRMKLIGLWTLLPLISALTTVEGLQVHKAHLRPKDPSSPFSFVLSSAMDLMKHPGANFLATQVWPSARVAAWQIETYAQENVVQSFCELGCGPGLPSLTAAQMRIPVVWATDLDELALSLVKAAANEQGYVVNTQMVDLRKSAEHLPDAQWYVLSDVFESADVARGAARICQELVRNQRTVWVFAQSDRVQREVFLKEMKRRLQDPLLQWSPVELGPTPASQSRAHLWLADIDETKVNYV